VDSVANIDERYHYSTGESLGSDTNHRRVFLLFGDYLRRHLVLILIAVSLCALILFPLADCFDCEGPRPWGRDDAAYAIRTAVFSHWLIGASFLAGFSRRRFGWTVPVAITLISCATEPLGGVALWSLLNNEGPVIAIFDGAIGLGAFFAGRVTRVLFNRLRSHRSGLRNSYAEGICRSADRAD
jgi:O-antigen/teichoic acid export membrane protein